MHYLGVYSLVFGALAAGKVTLPGSCFLPWGSDHTGKLFLAVVPIGFQSGFDGVVQPPAMFSSASAGNKMPATGARRPYVRPAGLRHAPDDQGNRPKEGYNLGPLKQMFGDVHLYDPSTISTSFLNFTCQIEL